MPVGRLLDPKRKQRERLKRSRRQEETVASLLGGRTHPGSGNKWHTKNDVSSKRWLVEAKTTEKGSYRMRLSDLNQLIANAIVQGKTPAMVVDLGVESFVVLRLSDAQDLGFRE